MAWFVTWVLIMVMVAVGAWNAFCAHQARTLDTSKWWAATGAATMMSVSTIIMFINVIGDVL